MRKAAIPHGLAALALALLAGGCGTIEFFQPSGDSSRSTPEPGAQTSPHSEAMAHYSLGLIAQNRGELDAAAGHFREAAERDPDNPELKLDLAIILLQLDRFEEFDTLIEQITADHPDLLKAHQIQALGYRLRGLHHKALPPIRRAIELEPGEPVHYIETASIHMLDGQFDRAENVLREGLGASTNRLAVYRALGELYLRQAGSMIKAGQRDRLPEAPLDVMREGADEFPDDLYVLNQYGDLLALHQRIEEAVDVFARIEELRPNDQELRQKLALSLIAVGDSEKAVQTLLDIAEKRPDNHRIWFYIGELQESRKDIDQAVAAYEKAIGIKPELPDGYLRKAYLELGHNRIPDARVTLERGMERLPDDLHIREMLAYVRMAEEQYGLAADLFREVNAGMIRETRTPMLTNFRLNYAISAQMAGEIDEAASVLREGSVIDPALITAFIEGTLRNRRSDERLLSALAVLDKVADLIPREPSVHVLVGLIAFNAEQYEPAQASFETAEQLALENESDEDLTPEFYFWLGACSERLKQYEKAEEYFLDAISARPDYAEAHNYLAYMHAENGTKLETALDHIGVALAVEPENPAYLDTRGWIYYRLGDHEAALADIEAAAELLPDDPTILDHLGDVHFALGSAGEAVRWWKASLEADDTNEAVREKIELNQPAEPVSPVPLTPSSPD